MIKLNEADLDARQAEREAFERSIHTYDVEIERPVLSVVLAVVAVLATVLASHFFARL